MTPLRFVLTPAAQEDLDSIWDHIAERNIDAADHVLEEMRRALMLLAENPGIGHARDDVTERPLKFWGVYSYLIVYDPASEPLRVLAVLHGARDLEPLIKER